MKRIVLVSATTPRAKHAVRYERVFAGRLAVRLDLITLSFACRTLTAKKHKHIAVGNESKAQPTGNEKRVLPIGHAPCQTVAHASMLRVVMAIKTSLKKTDRNKTGFAITTLYNALKAENIEKSAAKQPA